MKDGLMPYEFMDEWTYQYNQAYWNSQEDKYMLRYPAKDRDRLVKLKMDCGGVSEAVAMKASATSCYEITIFNEIWFKGFEKDDVGFHDLVKFIYDKRLIFPENSYQNKGFSYILDKLYDNKLIRPFGLHDWDFRYEGQSRSSVFEKLMKRMDEPDFHCARVCFCSSDSYLNTEEEADHDHVMTVALDDAGNKVVMDTSYRTHISPGNQLSHYITDKNIRWVTEMYTK